jgi:hypothetical protein
VDPEAAQILLLAITAVAVIVWLIGLRFLVASARAGKPGPGDENAETDFSPSAATNQLTGSAEVEGQPGVLAARAASVLAKGNPFGPIKIVEKTASRIVFERLVPSVVNQPASRWFRRGELRITPLGQGRSRVEWAVELTNMGWLLKLGALFQVLGLVAIAVGCWAIYTYVVSSPDPAVRWQTLQMLQVSHFLWPSFLVGGLYRRGRREVAARFEALAHNLPYYGD